MGKKKKDKKSLRHLMGLFGSQAINDEVKEFRDKYGQEELSKVFRKHEKRCY